jgi:cell division protein ZipA
LGELRLVLSGICLVLLAGIWWWSARGSRQARGTPELRESRAAAPAANPMPAAPTLHEAVEPREWPASPLEPLSIKTADFDRVPILDMPMMTDAKILEDTGEFEEISIDHERAPEPSLAEPADDLKAPRAAAAARSARGEKPERTASPARSAHASELQKIVTLRVCAVGDARWPGSRLVAALEAQGLAYGRYQVYHRNHADGRSLFCVASLVEPGTFDAALMAQQEFRGVSMFAVLPGPDEPLQTVDELVAAAKGLAEELTGSVQDIKGVPMSPQRLAMLRDEVARFQALLA